MVSNAEKEIVQQLLAAIFSHETLSKPIYCSYVRSEADASRLSADLPLIYIWNEDRQCGSFSISVNGPIVGSILEQKVPRSDASFERIRDEAMRVIRDVSQGSVVSTCQKLGALPSDLFR